MKQYHKKFRGSNLLCALLVPIAAALYPFYPSFFFFGEPEVPEILKEDLQ